MSRRVENLWMGAALLLIVAFVLCAPAMLAGCASITPPAPKTPAQTVYDIKAGLVAAEDVALGYEKARCGVTVPCTAPGADAINKAIVAADKAVNVAEAAVKANGADTSGIEAAQDAVKALQDLLNQYDPPTSAPPATSNTASTGGAL